jgi:bifunctional enzyme CysN/CysC
LANGHLGGILWFTGLSGSGKSTLAMALERELFRKGIQVYALDGDAIRQGLNADLGFSPEDRSENIRRVAQVARLFAESGKIVITALISPTRADRAAARTIGGDFFHEIHIDADLAVCESRDIKGLYKKARAGLIPEFTGVSAPYEAPITPELTLATGRHPLETNLADLAAYVEAKLIRPARTGAMAQRG